MSIKLDFNTKAFIKELGRTGNDLQITAAQSINESAGEMQEDYRKKLKRGSRIRAKFTLNAIKMFKANPVRRSGEPRALGKINAIVFIPKLKKKDHYLLKLEEGRQNKPNSMTLGKVPVPIKEGRTSMNENKPIAGINRLNKGKTQTLAVGGRKIGIKGDGYSGNPRKRWGVLYSGMRSGRLRGDVNKPFYFIGNGGSFGIYRKVRNVIRRIRHLKARVAKPEAKRYFKKTVEGMKPERIKKNFVRNAQRMVGRG